MKPCVGEWVKIDGCLKLKQVDAAVHGIYGVTSTNNVVGKRFTYAA